MFLKDLTNEEIRKKSKFKSQFELVNHAIKLAENMIKTGRDSRIKLDSQNKALQILAEIAAGKDQFDDIFEEEPRYTLSVGEELPAQSTRYPREGRRNSEHTMRDLPPKKHRKILGE